MAARNYSVLFLVVVVFIFLLVPLPATAGSVPSTTTLAASSSTITVGDTVTFTATVTGPGGTPTGLVTFFDGSTPLGSGTLAVVGGIDQAVFATSLLALADVNPPPHSISAVYNGDGTFASSTSSTLDLRVQRRSSTTSLALTPTTVVVGQPSTTTATATDAGTSFPPGTADTFATTGAPATGRTEFIATFFADGQVLVAGGTAADGKTVLQSAEIYSLSGAAFSATGNLNIARTGAVAVLLPNGKVLVAGGSSDGTANGALDSAELFDPVAGTFTLAGTGNSTNANHMTAARFGDIAILLSNGQVLLAGGENSSGVLSSAELYNPATDTFTACGNLGTARTGAVAILLRTGAVLVAGGSSDGTRNGALDTAELFSVDTSGTGSSLALTSTLSAGRWQAEIAPLPGLSLDNALIVGGQNSVGALTNGDVYNIRVFPGTFHPVANQMTVARAGGSAMALPNAEVLLAGGSTSQVAELYDFGSNKFEVTGDLLQSDNGLAGVALDNGQVLIVGLTSGATPVSDAELYSPAFPPLGQVGFSSTVNGDTFGSTCLLAPDSGSTSTCTSTITPAGKANPDFVTATYQADTIHATSSGPANLVVNPAATSTLALVTTTPTPFGQPIGFSANVFVSSPGSTAAPTGAVRFALDGTNIGAPVPLFVIAPGNSEADTPITILLPVNGSPHTLAANYINADGNFINSSDSFTGVIITPAVTATAVKSSQNPSSFGQAVTFTAIVQDTSAFSTAAPTGAVQFAVDGVNLGSPVQLTGASATTSTATSPADSTLTIGGSPHTVTAAYVNTDGNFTNSNGSLAPAQSVTQAGATVTVTPSPATITVGDTVTFTATVTSNSGSGTPTGLVTFFDGKTPLGNGILNGIPGNGQATFSTSLLPETFARPPRSITAIYEGDANFNASASTAPASVTVNLRNITTGVSLNPATVIVGQQTTATVTVNDAGASSPPGTPEVFSSTGAPATGRTGFSSALFADGQVLIAGGTDKNGTVLASAEIYSVSGASFVATNGNLQTPRTGALAVLLPNGKVLVAGGSSDGTANGALGSAELFDPVAGTFTTTAHNMTASRFAAMATLLANGQVLLSGGENSGGVLNTAELYDPVADTFTATGNLNSARTGASSTLLANGQVLIAGGSSDGTANGALNTGEIFDPGGNSGAGSFALLTSTLSAARWQPEAALGIFTDVLIAGGQNSSGALTSADRFNSGLNDFSALPFPMALGRANGSAVALPSGMVLLAGGAAGSQVTELFDPRNLIFLATGNLLQSDNGLVATLLNNGQVLSVGLTSGLSPQADAELYSPSFNPSGPLRVESSDNTQPILFVCHLTPSTTSATAASCAVTFAPLSAAVNPDIFTAGVGFGTIDGVHTTSIGTGTLSLNPASTTTAVASSANPSASGQPVTFTATVTNTSPGSIAHPTGTVQFVVDGANFGSPANLFASFGSTSTAVLSTSALAVSTTPHSVSANFVNGDGSFIASSGSLSGGQTVTGASTATTVVSSVPSPTYGQAVNFTATISNTGSGSTAAPTGSVQFVVDGQNFGAPVALIAGSGNTSTATSGSIGSLTVNGGSPHTVTANYLNADANFSSSSGPLSGGLQVVPAHLTVTANSQATIYSAAPFTKFSAILTGFVNGEAEAALRNSGALSGTPSFTGPAGTAVNAGQYTITPAQGTLSAANYDFPAADFASNTLTILKANTTSLTTEAATPLNDPVNGGSVSFVVVVTSTTGGTPTGSVLFTDDKNANLSALVSLSTASCPSGTLLTASCAKFSPAGGQLATGSQTITASYQGDGNFNSTSSGSIPSSAEVTILSAINTNPGATIAPQLIAFENGAALAAQNLSLSCAVQSAAIAASSQFPTCSLSSTSLPPSGSITVTITTAAPTTAALTDPPASVGSARAPGAPVNAFSSVLGLPAIGFLGLVLLTGRRKTRNQRPGRRVQLLLGLVLTLTTLLLLVSCGGGSSPPHTVGGTPTGTYLVSLVGTDVNHNQVVVAAIPLNVQ